MRCALTSEIGHTAGAVRRSVAQQIVKVFDQYMAFIALEPNMFSLGLADSYLELNNPTAKDYEIEVKRADCFPEQAYHLVHLFRMVA